MTTSASTTLTDEAGIESIYLTRKELAEKAGISVAEVRRRESMGLLIPAKRIGGNRNIPRYTPDQVDLLRGATVRRDLPKPVTYSGEEAQYVFQELRAGKPIAEIIIERGLHPQAARSIVKDYNELAGAIVLSPATVRIINELPLDGTFPVVNEKDILDLLTAAAKTDCERCEKRPKRFCKTCTPLVARKITQGF